MSKAKPRALVVEDELFVALTIEDALRSGGFEVEICPDPHGALRLARAFDPEVIVMDVNLGSDIDGVETARRLREDKDVPVLFVTAYSEASVVERIDQLIPGARVLNKPFSVRGLEREIDLIKGGLSPPGRG